MVTTVKGVGSFRDDQIDREESKETSNESHLSFFSQLTTRKNSNKSYSFSKEKNQNND